MPLWVQEHASIIDIRTNISIHISYSCISIDINMHVNINPNNNISINISISICIHIQININIRIDNGSWFESFSFKPRAVVVVYRAKRQLQLWA